MLKIQRFPFNRLPIIAKIKIISRLSIYDFEKLGNMVELSYLYNEYPYCEQLHQEFCMRYYYNEIQFKNSISTPMKWKVFFNRLSNLKDLFYKYGSKEINVYELNMYASRNELLELKIIYHERRQLPNIQGIDLASGHGHLETLIWLHSHNPTLRARTANLACKFGHMNSLNWLKTQNVMPDNAGIFNAVEKGQLEVLDWLIKEGYTITQDMIKLANKNLKLK